MTDEEKLYLKKLGANIKKIRLSKKIKQTELAYNCDFDRQNMYHIETGRHNLTITSLRKIAEALNVRICEIIEF
jgi:transcriptional regulator with XRE-family HTH domain